MRSGIATQRAGRARTLNWRSAPIVLLALLALFLVSCGGDDGGERLTLVGRDGREARLSIEIADDPEERQRGLSGRTTLPQDSGMLFVIEGRGSGFWMKDTSIPLSVAFIDSCGEIVAIEHMEPHTLQIHNSPKPYSFGLEVNRGWFEANSIGVGDKVLLPQQLRREGC